MASDSGWNTSSVIGAVGNTDYPTYRNKSGFSALPAGRRFASGSFSGIGELAYWWSSRRNGTYNDGTSAYARGLNYNTSSVAGSYSDREFGFNVRCVRDN